MEERVDSVIKRLGLESCKDTLVGGWLMRGISGGERKRTSIGYELITEPPLILLDEPTSGLDSSTALRTVLLLKNEANRGAAVLTTIHQPQARIFHSFDRVILMSEGYTIFNGPPGEVSDYFANFGMQINRFSNPADKMLQVAGHPSSCLREGVGIEEMAKACP